jgi:phosphatidylethanolamine-binding protein (PEBP) family uncharacterized protein
MAGLEIYSRSFGEHQPIPVRHANDYGNLFPAQEAAELAVLCEDPDAPRGTFTHWVLAGLQPTAPGLAGEGASGRGRGGHQRLRREGLRRPAAAGR